MKPRARKKQSRISQSRRSPYLRWLEHVFANPFLLYGGLAAFLLLISITQIATFQHLRSRTQDVFAPFVATIAGPVQSATSFLSDAAGLSALQSEVKSLREENTRLNDWYQTAQLLRAENQSLRALLNVKLEGQSTYLTTRVLSDLHSPYVKSAILNVGRKDGVIAGQAVLGEGGLLGRIVDVGEDTSRFLLISDVNSRIPVVIEGTNQKAILAGTNGHEQTLDYISETITVEKGMKIVTSGDGGLLPAGLPVGTVVSVKDGEVYVRPFAGNEQPIFARILERPEAKPAGSVYVLPEEAPKREEIDEQL
ncbi:MAG: rod shape-determining protein MreC [Pseudobdellovibrionaceae bacterium]